MNRLLLACNALLALFLAIQLVNGGHDAVAGERDEATWSARDMRVVLESAQLSRLLAGAPESGDRSLVVDLGAELPGFNGKQTPLELGLRLEPARDFACFQIAPQQLRLVLSQPLPPARRFSLHFGRELVAADSRKLPAGTVLAFDSARQFVRQVHVEDGPVPDQSPALVLEFALPVSLAAVQAAVRVESPVSAAAWRCEAEQGERSFRLVCEGRAPDVVDLVVDRKLSAIGGELGMTADYRAEIQVHEPLELRGAEAAFGHIDLLFNRSVPLPAPGMLQLEPPAPFQVLRRSGGLRLVGDFTAGSVWRLRLGEGFPGVGRARLRTGTARSLLVPDRGSQLDFAQSGSVLSSAALPQLLVKGTNVDEIAVRLRPVYANNVVRLLQRRDELVFAPSEVHRIAVHAARNQEFTQGIDLPALLGEAAHGLYQVEVWDGAGHNYPRRRLLQVTDLGVSVRASADAVAVQVLSIAGGAPQAGAEVEVVSPTNQRLSHGVTAADGTALLRWPAAAVDRSAYLVHVRTAADEVFVGLDGYGVDLSDDSLGGRPFLRDGCEAWVWPTRGMVRPGERLEAAVVLRDPAGAAVIDQDVRVEFVNPAGKVWRTQHLRSGASGLLTAALDLGADAPTGRWRLRVEVGDQQVGEGAFTVEAFVPNRLEASLVEVPPLRFGQSATVRVRANWLDGSPAAGRPVELRTRLLAGDFVAKDFPDHSFAGRTGLVPPGELELLRGTLDDRGEAELVLALPREANQQVLQAQLALEVLDPSGRAVHAAATALVLRPEFELGVRAGLSSAQVVTVDADGALVAAPVPVDVQLERRRWEWGYRSVGSSRWRWDTTLAVEALGEWHVTTTAGRAEVALPAAAAGEGWLVVVVRHGNQEVEQAIGVVAARPDRLRVEGPAAAVAPGATASLAVDSPAAGRGFVTVEAATILTSQVVTLAKGDNRIEVPLPKDAKVPNVHVVVTLTRPAVEARPGEGPPWLIGGTSVQLVRDEVATAVQLSAPAQVMPLSEVRCEVLAPGASRALVALVDEGVLQIDGHRSPDPLAFFLARRRIAGVGADTGAHLLQGMTFAPGTKTGGDGGDEDGMALGGSISPLIRPLALSAAIDLDAAGHGSVAFQLPEYEGRVRWMVVAAGPGAVGGAFAPTVVKAPLGLMLAGPRMVAPGDRFVVPVTLRNDTGAAGTMQLQWQVDGGLQLFAAPPPQVALAMGASLSLDVELLAGAPSPAVTPGLRVRASLGQHHREVAQAVLVRAPDAFATDYLGISLGAAQDIVVPADWQAHDLEVVLQLSGHPDQQLRPALESLLHYPYGCVEQTTSKGMALLACAALLPRILGDEAQALQSQALVQAAVDRLFAMQRWNGGFSWWPGGGGEYLYGTVYATDFLLRAKAAGAEVPEQALSRAVERLVSVVDEAAELPLRCHAIEVLARAGRPVQPRLDWLCTCASGPEERALLASALAQLGEPQRALAMLRPQVGDEALADVRDQGELLRSPLRLAALRFRALLAADPASTELPAQAQALQRAVLRPERLTTQEQAQALAALAQYFRVQPPASAVHVDGTFDGQPLPRLQDGVLRLPARPGAVLHLDAGGAGFLLLTTRGFRPVTPPPVHGALHLRVQFVDPDTGAEAQQLRRGSVYEVRITGDCAEELENVVFTQLLPGGVEAELPGAGARVVERDDPDLLRPTCIERRDDRVLMFVAERLPRHFLLVHRVRAVFPGTFECPPLLAQAMYQPGSDCTGGVAHKVEIRP